MRTLPNCLVHHRYEGDQHLKQSAAKVDMLSSQVFLGPCPVLTHLLYQKQCRVEALEPATGAWPLLRPLRESCHFHGALVATLGLRMIVVIETLQGLRMHSRCMMATLLSSESQRLSQSAEGINPKPQRDPDALSSPCPDINLPSSHSQE